MRYLLVFVAAVAGDRFSKVMVENNMQEDEKIEILDGRMNLTNVHNEGAFYGVFKKQPLALLVASIFGLTYLLGTYRGLIKNSQKKGLLKFSLSLLLGGAFGNLYDRFRNGYVTDFISIPSLNKFPVFNLADLYVFSGSIILLLKIVFRGRK